MEAMPAEELDADEDAYNFPNQSNIAHHVQKDGCLLIFYRGLYFIYFFVRKTYKSVSSNSAVVRLIFV